MATPMTTSPMTGKQVDRVCEIFRAKITKHAPEFSSEAVQLAFGQSKLSAEWLAVFRKYVEMFSDMIVRHVKVDRSKTPQEALDATGRKQFTDKSVVKSMPKGTGEEKEVFFFKLGHFTSDDDLENEFDSRGLLPVDPYSLAKVNEDDPSFADTHPNCTHWRDSDGKWCFATFLRWLSGRKLFVDRNGDDWGDNWWFAGVRK